MGAKKIKISICDDDLIIQNIIQKSCEDYLDERNINYRIELFNNGEEFLDYGGDTHILFLDVEMPSISGFQVARELNKRFKNMIIIFITSHASMIKEAFKVKAFRYLYKPLNREEFFEAIEEAIKEFTDLHSIIVKQKRESILIEKKNIIYIEALGDGSVIYTCENEYITTYTLKKWSEKINDENFFQCHKSFIVNLRNVIKIEQGYFLLKDNNKAMISIRNRRVAKEKLYEYISKNARYI